MGDRHLIQSQNSCLSSEKNFIFMTCAIEAIPNRARCFLSRFYGSAVEKTGEPIPYHKMPKILGYLHKSVALVMLLACQAGMHGATHQGPNTPRLYLGSRWRCACSTTVCSINEQGRHRASEPMYMMQQPSDSWHRRGVLLKHEPSPMPIVADRVTDVQSEPFGRHEDGRIEGVTAQGHATARLLDVNAEEHLRLRSPLMRQSWRL